MGIVCLVTAFFVMALPVTIVVIGKAEAAEGNTWMAVVMIAEVISYDLIERMLRQLTM